MSLRKQAKILGISPAHLSRMVNGIRPWNPGLKARYQELTGNTFGNIRPVDKAEMVGFVPVNGRVGHDIAEVTSSTLVPPTTLTRTGTTQALEKYLMSLRRLFQEDLLRLYILRLHNRVLNLVLNYFVENTRAGDGIAV